MLATATTMTGKAQTEWAKNLLAAEGGSAAAAAAAFIGARLTRDVLTRAWPQIGEPCP